MLLTAVLSLNGNMADVEGGSTESESHETLSHHSSDGDLSMQYSSSPFESDSIILGQPVIRKLVMTHQSLVTM